jgi:hypothetical protein
MILFSVSFLRFDMLLMLKYVNTLPESITARIKIIVSLDAGFNEWSIQSVSVYSQIKLFFFLEISNLNSISKYGM